MLPPFSFMLRLHTLSSPPLFPTPPHLPLLLSPLYQVQEVLEPLVLTLAAWRWAQTASSGMGRGLHPHVCSQEMGRERESTLPPYCCHCPCLQLSPGPVQPGWGGKKQFWSFPRPGRVGKAAASMREAEWGRGVVPLSTKWKEGRIFQLFEGL